MAQALDRLVVQIDFGDECPAVCEGIRIGGKTVVLRGDGHLAGLQVLHRLVAAAVAEFEFEGRAAQGVRDHLVAEADAEGGKFGQQVRDGLVDVGQRGRVAGTVGKEDAIHAIFAHLLRGCRGGKHMHLEAVTHQLAEDRVFCTEVEGCDLVFLHRGVRDAGRGTDRQILGIVPRRIVTAPEVGLPAGDVLHIVASRHVAPVAGAADRLVGAHRACAQAAFHRPVDAQFLGERPGVHLADARDTVFSQVIAERHRAAPVADHGRDLAHHESRAFRGGRFLVLDVDAVVADLHGGHRHDLAEVGGIGQDLLVTGHRGVEDAFPGDGGLGAKGSATEYATIFQG